MLAMSCARAFVNSLVHGHMGWYWWGPRQIWRICSKKPEVVQDRWTVLVVWTDCLAPFREKYDGQCKEKFHLHGTT